MFMNRKITNSVLAGIALLVLSVATSHGSETYVDYAPVVRVEEVYETYNEPVKREECTFERTSQQRQEDRKLAGDVRQRTPGFSLAQAIRFDAEHVRSQQPAQRCRMVTKYESHERVAAYKVTYRYNGATYVKQMSYHPGDEVKVRVRVDPSGHYTGVSHR